MFCVGWDASNEVPNTSIYSACKHVNIWYEHMWTTHVNIWYEHMWTTHVNIWYDHMWTNHAINFLEAHMYEQFQLLHDYFKKVGHVYLFLSLSFIFVAWILFVDNVTWKLILQTFLLENFLFHFFRFWHPCLLSWLSIVIHTECSFVSDHVSW